MYCFCKKILEYIVCSLAAREVVFKPSCLYNPLVKNFERAPPTNVQLYIYKLYTCPAMYVINHKKMEIKKGET